MQKQYYYSQALIATTAAALTTYKVTRPLSLTPMAECFAEYVKHNTAADCEDNKMRFFRIARQLGWNVKRRGGDIYENGVKVWQLTTGN